MSLSELDFFTHLGMRYSINVNKFFITLLTIILRITRHRKSTKKKTFLTKASTFLFVIIFYRINLFETESHSNYFVRWRGKVPLFDEEKMPLELYVTYLLCLKTVIFLESFLRVYYSNH